MNYIATTLLTTNIGIIQKDKIDTNDEMYKAWMEDESINLYTYLNHAISKNWIDTSVLQNYMSADAKYSDASEIYQAILTFTLDHLKTVQSAEPNFALLCLNKMFWREMRLR